YEMTSCFQFSTFPWLPLTSTDKQVLTSTDSSLRSSNPVLVANSCEFLSQVVLKDFPAEIFLQRPNIVQSLLALLKLKPPHEHTLPLSAVKCLKDLSINLQARITFYHDPALYCPKQVDFGTSGSSNSSSNSNSTLQSSLISVSRPTVLGYSGQRLRGDGQEGDSSLTSTPMQSPRHGNILQESSSDVETDSEDMIALQFGQITVPQFCILVLEHATPLLKTNNADMVVHCTKLLTEILQLLKQAIGQDIWQEKSVVAREVTEKLVDVFEILGDVLLHHHHSKGNISENMVEHDIIQHRLAFIMISMYVTQFIESLLPIDKASDVLPESLNSALCLVVMDYTLCLTYPNIKDIALKYITETNSDQYEIYNSAMSVYDSMQSACKFLKTCDYQCDVSVQVQISMAEEALHSIPYHYHMPLVEKFIHLCSDICKPINVNTSLVTQCTKVFLKYLAHPLGKVKTCSYTVILDIVKDALGITQVTQPGLLTYSNVKFLLDSQILYEISCFGMTDGDEQVSLMARQILLYLLQSKLLMSSAVWKQFIDVLLPVISILQAYVEKQTNLGTSILDIIHCKPEDKDKKGEPLLPKLDHFRCNLRLMFSKSCSVRSETIKHILEFLSKEEDSCNKLPTSTQAALTDMGNLFIMDQPVTIDDSHNSVFQ
ncbi:rotatin-like, partial [Saccoglossus kowalevskii]|uniref:Rotatin-like n=1 Tax=Saccoglossus kowalevskii TaxID=10224 RepID=A0ABM0MTK7_SACKO